VNAFYQLFVTPEQPICSGASLIAKVRCFCAAAHKQAVSNPPKAVIASFRYPPEIHRGETLILSHLG
jgi:hypothetical protein